MNTHDFEYKIRIQNAKSEYWDWACKNLPIGTWKGMIPITGTSETFCFKNEEDLLVFKIVFGL
jgi:hypothetical protein